MSVVERFINKSEVIDRTRRLPEKVGSTDEESLWAKARVVQSAQLCKQLYGLFKMNIQQMNNIMQNYFLMKIINKLL